MSKKLPITDRKNINWLPTWADLINKRYSDEHKDSSLFLSNFFMAYIETQSLSKTVFKPTVWKRYVDDIFSLWDISKPDIVAFFAEQVNLHALLWNSRPKYLKMRHSF